MGERVAGDRVVMGRDHQEANPPGPERVAGGLQHRHLAALGVAEHQIQPVQPVVGHQPVERDRRQRADAPVALAPQADPAAVLEPHRRLHEAALHVVEREVAPTDLQVVGVGLDHDVGRAGQRALEPHRVIGPEGAQLHHRLLARLGRQPLDDAVEDQLLLRLVVAAQAPDDLRHEGAVVAALFDQDAVVHHLDALSVLVADLAGVGHLRDRVGVANRDGDLHASVEVVRIWLGQRHGARTLNDSADCRRPARRACARRGRPRSTASRAP